MATGGTGGAGGGGMQNLGGAVYTVTANTAPFAQGMTQAQQGATQTTTQIVQAFGGLQVVPRQLAAINQSIMATNQALHGLGQQSAATAQQMMAMLQTSHRAGAGVQQAFGRGGGAAMGLMMLGQLIDDAQYGFRSIVNNIPGVGMAIAKAFGAGDSAAMAFGGTLGIVAVAVNQAIQHWDELKATLGDTAPWETVEGAVAMLKDALGGKAGLQGAMEGAKAAFFGALGGTPPTEDRLRVAREKAENDAKAERGADVAEKLRSEEEERRGKDFRKAVAEAGGGEKIVKALADEAEMSARKAGASDEVVRARRDRAIRSARIAMAEGAEGKEIGDRLGEEVPRKMEAARKERTQKARDALAKSVRAFEKDEEQFEEREEKKEKARRRHAMAIEHREEMYGLQDRMKGLRKEEKAVRAEVDSSRPFKGDYFDYATSHGEKFMEKQANEKLDVLHKDMEKLQDIMEKKQREYARMGD